MDPFTCPSGGPWCKMATLDDRGEPFSVNTDCRPSSPIMVPDFKKQRSRSRERSTAKATGWRLAVLPRENQSYALPLAAAGISLAESGRYIKGLRSGKTASGGNWEGRMPGQEGMEKASDRQTGPKFAGEQQQQQRRWRRRRASPGWLPRCAP